MKKVLYILILLSIIYLTGCQKQELEKNNSNFPSENDIIPGFENDYYTFTAETKHFKIHEGRADYRDNAAIFSLKKLECLDPSFVFDYIEIKTYFKDQFYSFVKINQKDFIENRKENITEEHGFKIKRDKDGNFYGEISTFMKTSPKDFPTSIKIISNVCDIENKCIEEPFTLDIQKVE